MSWFTTYVEHPALNALAGLLHSPAISNNAAATAAVRDAQAQATTIASAASAAAGQVAASVQAAANPILQDTADGLKAVADAYLMATLGPVGAAAVPLANTVIDLGEAKFHDFITALFSHARNSHAAAAAAATAPAQQAA